MILTVNYNFVSQLLYSNFSVVMCVLVIIDLR